ncbi:flagellar basal body L-ring protein FlgH [Myxococcota bacterium]|nr:flagellar basal body L-ring protein FlgH [Myxococcota bacterium]
MTFPTTTHRLGALTLALTLTTIACATEEAAAPKKRVFQPGEYGERPKAASGSLYARGGQGFMEDSKPVGLGDILVVRVDESVSASNQGSTQLDRKSQQNLGISGALEKLAPEVGLPALFGSSSQSTFAGSGRIQHQGKVNAILPVHVTQVLPNGDFYIEGTKTVLIGGEKRELYVSGVVKPIDVLADGSVFSSRIADAQIEYTGEGDVSDQEERGWLTKLLTVIWPF